MASNSKIFAATSLALLVLGTSACADRRRISPTTESTPSSDTSGNARATDEEPLEEVTDCTKKDCDKATLVVKLVDLKTGGFIDELKGGTNQQVTWGLKVEPKRSSHIRKILLKVEDPPEDVEVTTKDNSAVILGSFGFESSGTLDTRSRDVDYCKQNHSDPEECDDMDEVIEDIDVRDTAPFNITQSEQDQALSEAEQKAKSQQSKAATTSCITGLFTVITGNIAGAAGCIGAVAGGLGN